MPLIKGIATFPNVHTPKVAKGANEPKFSISILLPPNDPQVPGLKAEVEQAKLNGFPSGYIGKDECLQPYDNKYQGKEYYDNRFSGWWVFSCSAKADDRPAVVDANHQPIIDPSRVFSGMVAYVNAGISAYTKGKGGIGGWLNGVMVTDEEPPMGRLDGKPTVEEMFAGAGQPPAQPRPATPPAPPVPPAPATLQMTAAANGVTLEAYRAQGWTDDQLIANGLAIRPSFV